MRYVIRFLGIGGLLGLFLASFTNFTPVKNLSEDFGIEVPHLHEDLRSAKQYVKINGKYYEKNERGIYHIDGVPTMVKTGKRAEVEKPSPRNSNLGPPIDPKIFKDAMGLHEDDEFFKPKTSAEVED